MKAKNKKRTGERIDRLDWFLTIGELLLFLPRLFGRALRRWFDWY